MVLNALDIDPQRVWKGPWRWFSETLLDCCTPLDLVKREGITFSDFVCLATCHGADVEAFRPAQKSLDQFRVDMVSTLESPGKFVVVSFGRAVLGQTGDGHFAALAGYHRATDRVLVLDTAKFKYPAFWCSVSLLYDSMKATDAATGLARGYFVLKQQNRPNPRVTLADNPDAWPVISTYLTHTLPLTLQHRTPTSVEAAVRLFLDTVPRDLYQMIRVQASADKLLPLLRKTPLFQVVQPVLKDTPHLHQERGMEPELATLLLLACPAVVYRDLPPQLREQFKVLRDTDHLPEVNSACIVLPLTRCRRLAGR